MLKGLVLARCPRCRRGAIFKKGIIGSLGVLNETCPVCGLRYLREAGYFLGAMYISYGLDVLTVLPVSLIMVLVLEWPLAVVLAVTVAQTLVSAPLFFRYSRVIWLYLDQAIDPR